MPNCLIFASVKKVTAMDQKNVEFLRNAQKVYFVAMEGELDSSQINTPVIFCGVGKGRATRAIVRYIFDHHDLFASGEGPVIISLGTAGSGKFKKGEIVLADNFTNIGDRCIRVPFAFNTFPVPTGISCASSDYFVGMENFSPEEIDGFHKEFDCMDMESYALASVCYELGLKFCAVKCISDGADKNEASFDEELPRFKKILTDFAKSLE